MKPTIDQFFQLFDFVNKQPRIKKYLNERELKNLRINDSFVNFETTNNNEVEAELEINFSDPSGVQPNEDLVIIATFDGRNWNWVDTEPTKL